MCSSMKKFKEDLFTYCIEYCILQDSSEPSNENTNVVNALQEPFVIKQDPGKNSSQSPPQINHHCCYGCGDSLEDIFHQCTCELCGKEDYTIAITPILSTDEPDNSLSMRDEHLDTVPATESDEFIKCSVEHLVPIPSEFEGIPDNMSSHPDSELVSSEAMEIVILKVGDIDDDIILTIKDDILREELLNINLPIANIEALKYNPTPSFDFMTKSSFTSLNFLLEETNTFDNCLP
nr:hypothetical protein [Tanacetum cinerariifolium]